MPIRAFLPQGPTLLSSGVLLGLALPDLADAARPLMPLAIFLIVLGPLLTIDLGAVGAALAKPIPALVLPLAVMVASPLAAAALAGLAGLGTELALAIVLAAAVPPSSGTTAVAQMLGLDGAVPLVATLVSMALAPVTVPLIAAWFGGLSLAPLVLALKLAALVGGAAALALLARRYAAGVLAAHGRLADGITVLALLVFALAAMAGMRAAIGADPALALRCLALAFAVNIGLQLTGALVLPGSFRERVTVGLVLGNRNVGLVWSALGAAASPKLALYFAASQLPIYILPRFVQILCDRQERAPAPVSSPVGKSADAGQPPSSRQPTKART